MPQQVHRFPWSLRLLTVTLLGACDGAGSADGGASGASDVQVTDGGDTVADSADTASPDLADTASPDVADTPGTDVADAECVAWLTGPDCDTCVNPLKTGPLCTKCLDPKKTGEQCDACLDPKRTGPECNECLDLSKVGPNCDEGRECLGADCEPTCVGDDAGGADCPCTGGDDCDSGYCLVTPAGQRCARFCSETCVAATTCVSVSTGGDITNICVPNWPKLCNPCSTNEACASLGNGAGRCVDQGAAGAFCGTACDADGDCPVSYACMAVKDIAGQTAKQCVRKDGAACTCTPWAVSQGLSTHCSIEAGDAKCQGTRTCLDAAVPGTPPGSLGDCALPESATETCDGQDNDCNGQTDEATCEDQNPCTTDGCDPQQGCLHAPVSDGTSCGAGKACAGGVCG